MKMVSAGGGLGVGVKGLSSGLLRSRQSRALKKLSSILAGRVQGKV